MAYIAADDVLSDFAVGSLQQLRRLASENANVAIAAQFDANGKQNIPRLIFRGVEDKSTPIQEKSIEEIDSGTDMAEPETLKAFINWAYEKSAADHYCLVLWGHGPELLANDYPVLPSGKKPKRFLTPSDIRMALENSKLRKFEIVAVDACSMSMMELACELKDHAEFLVASQEDVPDFSFPYDKLLTFGDAKDRNDIASVCKELPARYIGAYKDYTLTKATQTASITLSSLSLKDVGTVTEPLRQLVDAFWAASGDEVKRRAIIDARANSREFVVGLYVDLYDFCERLSGRRFSSIVDDTLISACDKICDAIRSRGDDAFVIANEVSQDKKCHGISIYFPYLNEPAKDTANTTAQRGLKNGEFNYGQQGKERSGAGAVTRGAMSFTGRSGVELPGQGEGATRSRGGLDLLSKDDLELLSKGGLDLLSKGGLDLLSKLRRQRIGETEQYYAGLRLSNETRWDKFIRHHWSRWLVEDVETRMKKESTTDLSEVLNRQYSAQQCALNLLSRCRELEAGGTSEDTGSADVRAGAGGPQKPTPPNGVATTR